MGIFGYVENATFSNLKFENIDISGKDYVGGFVGYGLNSNFTNISFSGVVNGKNQVGLVFGNLEENNIVDTINVEGEVGGADYVGGLSGKSSESIITNSYLNVNVKGTNKVGGLIGGSFFEKEIKYIISLGKINGTSNAGGIIGEEVGPPLTPIANSFYDTIINSHLTSNNIGEGKTTDELEESSTYTDFSMDKWNIKEGETPNLFTKGSETPDDAYNISLSGANLTFQNISNLLVLDNNNLTTIKLINVTSQIDITEFYINFSNKANTYKKDFTKVNNNEEYNFSVELDFTGKDYGTYDFIIFLKNSYMNLTKNFTFEYNLKSRLELINYSLTGENFINYTDLNNEIIKIENPPKDIPFFFNFQRDIKELKYTYDGTETTLNDVNKNFNFAILPDLSNKILTLKAIDEYDNEFDYTFNFEFNDSIYLLNSSLFNEKMVPIEKQTKYNFTFNFSRNIKELNYTYNNTKQNLTSATGNKNIELELDVILGKQNLTLEVLDDDDNVLNLFYNFSFNKGFFLINSNLTNNTKIPIDSETKYLFEFNFSKNVTELNYTHNGITIVENPNKKNIELELNVTEGNQNLTIIAKDNESDVVSLFYNFSFNEGIFLISSNLTNNTEILIKNEVKYSFEFNFSKNVTELNYTHNGITIVENPNKKNIELELNVTEGNQNLTIIAKDNKNNNVTLFYNFSFNKGFFLISSNLTNNSKIPIDSETKYSFEFNFSKNVTELNYTYDGTTITQNSNKKKIQLELEIFEGNQNLTIIAKDNESDVVSLFYNFTFNKYIRLLNTSIKNNTDILIEDIKDYNFTFNFSREVDIFNYTYNNTEETLTSAKNKKDVILELPIIKGNQNLTIKVFDKLGNNLTQFYNFSFDNNFTLIKTDIINNTEIPIDEEKKYNFTFNFSRKVKTFNYTHNGITQTLSNQNKNINITLNVSKGTQNLTINAFDLLGNSITQFYNFSFDTNLSLLNTSLTNNDVIYTGEETEYTFTFNFSRKLTSFNYTYNNSEENLTTAIGKKNIVLTIPIINGKQNLTIKAFDSYNNKLEISYNFTFNNAIVIENISFINNTNIRTYDEFNHPFTFNFSRKVKTFNYTYNGTTRTLTNQNKSVSISLPIRTGNQNLNIIAFDNSGNNVTKDYSFTFNDSILNVSSTLINNTEKKVLDTLSYHSYEFKFTRNVSVLNYTHSFIGGKTEHNSTNLGKVITITLPVKTGIQNLTMKVVDSDNNELNFFYNFSVETYTQTTPSGSSSSSRRRRKTTEEEEKNELKKPTTSNLEIKLSGSTSSDNKYYETKKVEIKTKEEEVIEVEFYHDFKDNDLDLKSFQIIKESNEDNNYIIIKNLNLQKGLTKNNSF